MTQTITSLFNLIALANYDVNTIKAAKSDGPGKRREEDEDDGRNAHQAERVRDVAPIQRESLLDLTFKFTQQARTATAPRS